MVTNMHMKFNLIMTELLVVDVDEPVDNELNVDLTVELKPEQFGEAKNAFNCEVVIILKYEDGILFTVSAGMFLIPKLVSDKNASEPAAVMSETGAPPI